MHISTVFGKCTLQTVGCYIRRYIEYKESVVLGILGLLIPYRVLLEEQLMLVRAIRVETNPQRFKMTNTDWLVVQLDDSFTIFVSVSLKH